MNKDIARFWSKVNVTEDENECWGWRAGKDRDGYPIFWFNGKTVKAHRFLMEYIELKSIINKCVCHVCDNPSCVNPTHLFVGTSAENTKDRDDKGRQARGKKCNLSKLLEEDVVGIRLLAKKGLTHRIIGERFEMSRPQISSIVRRVCWKHI